MKASGSAGGPPAPESNFHYYKEICFLERAGRPRSRIKIISFSLFFFLFFPIYAAKKDTRLQKIDQQIASLKAHLHKDLAKKSQLQQELAKAEIARGKLQTEITQTSSQLNQQKNILSQLLVQKKNLQTALQQQRLAIAQQLRATYLLGNQIYLKLLLNQQDPSQMGRILVYYRHITQNRLQVMTKLQTTLQQVQDNQQRIETHYRSLSTLESKQQNQRKRLEVMNNSRRSLIQSVSATIKTKNQNLDQLQADKRRLEQMLAELERKSLRQIQFAGTKNFIKGRGRLPWPTRGRIINSFGTPIEQSELKWTGVLIKANQGQPVYAIANGKVVFAKWLSGYGLLIIIYHGDGYMTLYGRNQYLYKKEGDTVQQGEQIAAVGESGGFQTSALYFAIRRNVQAINPAVWCRGNPNT